MTMGERIRDRRRELNLTQDELAQKAGYRSRSSINKIEKTRELPLKKVSAIARALECSPAYIMGWTDDPNEIEVRIEAERITGARVGSTRLLMPAAYSKKINASAPKPEHVLSLAEQISDGDEAEDAADDDDEIYDDAYYLLSDAADIAQELLTNKDLRALLDAARDARPEDLKMVTDMLRRFKETNPDG